MLRESKASSHNRLSVTQKELLVEELLLPHLDAAYNLARWIVESDPDAQIVVQEAFAYASEQFAEFCGADAGTRLLTIVRNRAYRRTRGRRNLWPFREAIRLLSTHKSSQAFSREERDLHAALGRLPVELREILVLCDIEGWSYAQLAAVLDLSTAAVASRLNQARLLLRREIQSFPNSASSYPRSLISRKLR
jgi:RNA polymerase sigma-70 factor (ECF subfamily)